MHRLQQIKTLIPALLLASFMFFSVSVLFMGVVYAAPPITLAEAESVCDRKVDKPACLEAVRKCPKPPTPATKSACLRTAVSAGDGKEKAPGEEDVLSLDTGAARPYQCGNGDDAVETQFNFGCQGKSAKVGTGPIEDLAYALIRFLSFGVGLVLAASIIYAGIQYTSSTGNPEATSAAKKRIVNAFIALFFYLLIFALVQYLVPGGLFTS